MGRGHILSSNVACVDGPDWPPLPEPDVDEGCSWAVRVAKRAFPSDQHPNVSTQILPQSSGLSCSRPSAEDAVASSQTFFTVPQYRAGSVLACATCGDPSNISIFTSNPAFLASSACSSTSVHGTISSACEYRYNLGVCLLNHGSSRCLFNVVLIFRIVASLPKIQCARTA